MDLSNYKFPDVNKVDLVFNTFDTIPELLEEAKKRNPKKGMEKFSQLFFHGGKIEFQKDVEGSWKENAFIYARALMGSFAPKHEHKALVVGMIFEEVLVF
jgi:hypothetical protein